MGIDVCKPVQKTWHRASRRGIGYFPAIKAFVGTLFGACNRMCVSSIEQYLAARPPNKNINFKYDSSLFQTLRGD